MKKIIIFLPLFFVLFNGYAQPKKHALLIGISKYHSNTGWGILNTEKDIELLQHVLQTNHGFEPVNIQVLRNEKATKEGIRKALTELEEKAASGDVICFHFSGHGQRIFDSAEDGRLDEPDGYDEALIPYNARATYTPEPGGYTGQFHLRDDLLATHWQAIRKKLGPQGQLFISIDACHSGGALRDKDLPQVRGAAGPFAPPNFKPGNLTAETLNTGYELPDEAGLAPVILFSGSASDEPSFQVRVRLSEGEELIEMGSLSYGLFQALSHAQAGLSYYSLFRRVRAIMGMLMPMQRPQYEGNIRAGIFGSTALSDLSSGFMVQNPYRNQKDAVPNRYVKEITVQAGSLMGLYKGAKVQLHYERPSEPGKTLITKGKVSDVKSLTATVQLDRKESFRYVLGGIVKPLDLQWGETQVRLKIALHNKRHEKELKEKIANYRLFQWDAQQPELLITDTDSLADTPAKLRIFNTAGQNILTLLNAALPSTEDVLDRLLNYAKSKVLHQLNPPPAENDSVQGLQLAVIPIAVREGSDGKKYYDRSLGYAEAGADSLGTSFPEGTVFAFQLHNPTAKRLYFNIVGADSYYDCNVKLPRPNENIAEMAIEPGKTLLLSQPHQLRRLAPPYGTDLFKVLAAEEPFDLRPVFNPEKVRAMRSKPKTLPPDPTTQQLYELTEALLRTNRNQALPATIYTTNLYIQINPRQ